MGWAHFEERGQTLYYDLPEDRRVGNWKITWMITVMEEEMETMEQNLVRRKNCKRQEHMGSQEERVCSGDDPLT